MVFYLLKLGNVSLKQVISHRFSILSNNLALNNSTMVNNNNPSSDIILYNTPDGHIRVEVMYAGETFWLTQKRMAELFGCTTDNISLHLKNIFKENELEQKSVTEEFSVTAADGKNYNTKFYNLDAIIAVGYRVNSLQATQFRIWATKTFSLWLNFNLLSHQN
jgi:hypothetical protein